MNVLASLPDNYAEIRAPAGTLSGVNAFQIRFASEDIHTTGHAPDVLVALNPAGLRTHLDDIPEGGTLIVNEDAFTSQNLTKAGYESNPLTDNSLAQYRLIPLPITSQNQAALSHLDMSPRQAGRSKNFYALGIVYWLYDRPLEPTLRWFEAKWGSRPHVVAAKAAALKAGYAFAETIELFTSAYRVPPASLLPGTFRNITMKVWGLTPRQVDDAFRAWRSNADLLHAMSDLTAATDLLVRYLKADRIPSVVRKRIPGCRGDSLLTLLKRGDTRKLLTTCRDMFRFERAHN